MSSAKAMGTAFRATPPEVVTRAATLIGDLGDPGDFVELRYGDPSDVGYARRARDKVIDLMNGRLGRWEDAHNLHRKAASSILKIISGTLARDIESRPHRLVTADYARHGLEEPLLDAEYIAASLRLLLMQGERGNISLADVVTAEHVAALQMLIDAARAMSYARIQPVLAAPLGFVEIANTHDGLAIERAEVNALVAAHYVALNDRAARACSDVLRLAVTLIERIDPDEVKGVDIGARSFVGQAATPDDCIASSRLITPLPSALKEACLLGQHQFFDVLFNDSLRALTLGGFVDTASSRAEAVQAACECVGAYVEGFKNCAGYLRFVQPYDAERVQFLCMELADLRGALRNGPLAAEVEAELAASASDARLEAAVRRMRNGLTPRAAAGDQNAHATLAALDRLR